MNDAYQPPSADLVDDVENNSGMGRDIVLPPGVKGWSWGAFLLNWIWAIGNRTWIGLLAFLPYVGFIMSIILGSREGNGHGKTGAGTVWNILTVFKNAGLSGVLFSYSVPHYSVLLQRLQFPRIRIT